MNYQKLLANQRLEKVNWKGKRQLKRWIERGKTFDRVSILIFNVWTHNVEEAFDYVEEGESENKLY